MFPFDDVIMALRPGDAHVSRRPAEPLFEPMMTSSTTLLETKLELNLKYKTIVS